ncbi:MAG: DNA repair protein RecN [Clostridiales bacterium]|nr:DNA repair protein RecN [Clostridiales bacterium]
MIASITIENIAVIERLTLDFEQGFNVLTGETAAGKSIIIDAINMVLGGRVSRELIRSGTQKAVVEAFFTFGGSAGRSALAARLDEFGIDSEDGELAIHREVHIDGRSVCRVNGSIVTASILRAIAENLVNIHGQHDNQALLNPSKHIEFLDKFANVDGEKADYKAAFSNYKEILGKLEALTLSRQEQERRLETAQSQLEEIKSVGPKLNEDAELKQTRTVLENSAKLFQAAKNAYEALYSDEHAVVDTLARLLREIGDAGQVDEHLKELAQQLEGAQIVIEDVSHQFSDYADKIERSPLNSDEIEARLYAIQQLQLKYGAEISDILEYQAKLEEEIFALTNSENVIADLQKQVDEALQALTDSAEKLTKKRAIAAQSLQERVIVELADLEMARVRFEVNIQPQKFAENGADSVEFLISTNMGEPLKPLVKIASGGELSRIMLAIKSILADADDIGILIFDEIDAGISGRAAQKTAEKLAKIGKIKQILCITHLAQIASAATTHFLIKKEFSVEKTTTRVLKLNAAGREQELARIMGGAKITDLTLQNAREMLEMAEA